MLSLGNFPHSPAAVDKEVTAVLSPGSVKGGNIQHSEQHYVSAWAKHKLWSSTLV